MGKEGLVLMTDQSYKATIFATNKIGYWIAGRHSLEPGQTIPGR